MNLFQAIILGVLQGLTEFLPISSTAHLTIAGKWFGLINEGNPEHWTAFMAVIQMGTLLAVLVYFYKDIKQILSSYFSENLGKNRIKFSLQSHNSKLGWYIIIGTLPIVVIGLALKDIIEGQLTKELSVIAISLISLGVLLAVAELFAKFRRDMEGITMKDALIIGLAQCLALIPGASRSGTTLTAGLFTGLKRDTAARFSFLLSIPAVFASGLLEFYQSLEYISSSELFLVIVATLAAAISGYAAIAFLLKFLKKNSTWLFVIYRILLGAALLTFFV